MAMVFREARASTTKSFIFAVERSFDRDSNPALCNSKMRVLYRDLLPQEGRVPSAVGPKP